MRKKILLIIAAVLLIAGIVFLLFEPVATEVEKNHAESAAREFDEVVAKVRSEKKVKNASPESRQSEEVSADNRAVPTAEQLARLLADSKAYNKRLINNQGTVSTTDYTSAALDLSRYGIYDNMYGYISAPAIGMKLPVYLGAGEAQLSSGAAHLCNTSLPLGTDSTHVVIAGHTGYFGRIFFDNIRALSVGDSVSVTNYWHKITYRVIGKKTVSPKNTSDLVIRNGRALMTLVTCVPDGKGGFDRCLVICERK